MADFQKPYIVELDQLARIRGENTPKEVDIYELQKAELRRIQDPSGVYGVNNDIRAVWIYYPWKNILLHSVDENTLFTIRTNRNRELITAEEQARLAGSTVGVAGMSVGSGIAIGLHYAGISKHMKIADNDVLDNSNLNRLRESLLDVGKPKVMLAAEHIYELDPFVNVELFPEGLTSDTIDNFFGGLDVVIDEIDDFKMKVQMRLHAKKHRVPLLMFTSLGDNILIDVERYDHSSNQRIFNGLLGDGGEEILSKSILNLEDIKRYSVMLVGQEYIPTKAIKSVTKMGKTLVGRPQLYSTIAVDGGLAVFIIRNILLGKSIKSGRYFIEFAKLVGMENTDLEQNSERKELLELIFGHTK